MTLSSQSQKTTGHVIDDSDSKWQKCPKHLGHCLTHKMEAVSFRLASLRASAPNEEGVLRGAVCRPRFSNKIPGRHEHGNVAQPARLLKAPSLGSE